MEDWENDDFFFFFEGKENIIAEILLLNNNNNKGQVEKKFTCKLRAWKERRKHYFPDINDK